MDRAGLVGDDGPTHHGAFDLTYLSAIPDMVVAAPKDGNELRAMLHYTIDHDLNGPVALRYPREAVPTDMRAEIDKIEWGSWERLTSGSRTAVLAVGSMVTTALQVAEILKEKGTNIAVTNCRFVKPLDLKMLDEIRQAATTIITIEENTVRGGFGQAVAEHLADTSYTGRIKAIGIPDRFVTHGNRDLLLKEIGLDPESLADRIQKVAEGDQKSSRFFGKLSLRKNGNMKKKVLDAAHTAVVADDN
jgi:1-deoxy-D-xylulose-5-phosphate synthase